MTNSTRCTLLAKQACTTLSHVVQKITPPSANNFLKLFFALFAMLALGVRTAWGEESVVYTLAPATGSNNSYAGNCDITISDITWNLTGNSTMIPWRIGGKSLTKVDRTLYSKKVMPHKVTKIEVEHGTASNVTVNSFKLIVASDANFSNVISTVEATFKASATTTLECPSGADWSKAFYKFVYNVTIGSDNKFLQFTKATFYGEASTTPGEGEEPSPDPEDPETPGTGSSTGWVETAIGNISSSDIVVVTMTNSSGTYAMSNDKGTGAAPAAVKVTVDGDKLSADPTDNLKWNISYSSSSLTIYPNGDATKWLYCTATNNGVRVGTNTNKTFTIDATSGYLKHTGTTRYLGVYNSQDWRCYTTATTTNIANQTLKFYKYVEQSSEGGGTEETAVSVPTFSVPEGTFYSPINVELSCSTADAEIHYTLDGSTPSSTSEKYTTAIAISETTTVKAIAIKTGHTDSEVATATYTKGETVTSYDINFETNALEAYVNWDFSNITIDKTITAKEGTYYGNTSGKASASIKTKEKIQYPGILTFSVSKESTNTTASNWLVQVSENGTTWSTVGTISATEMTKGNWKDHSVDLSDYENVYVQISYGSSTAVRAIDEISLAQGVAPVKYTLTIESPENGTLLVTNGGASVASGDQFKAGTSLVVTPTPASSYLFESLTVDGTPVELTEGSYTFTMPAADVTIAATFKESVKPAATLILSKNEDTSDKIEGKVGDVITLPDFTSDCSKTFVGWDSKSDCTDAPEYAPGAEYTLAAETQTLYAVYADIEKGKNEWKETPISDITSTDLVVVTMTKSGTTYALFSGNGASAAPTASTIDIDIENNIIKDNIADKYTWNIETNDGKFTLYPKGTTSTWLYCTNTNNGVRVGTNSDKVFTIEGNYMKHIGTSRYVGVYVTNPDWRCYTDTDSNIKDQVLKFYKNTPTYAYSNYSTTCAAAPKAEVTPTEVTAIAAGVEGKVTVTYENVNTENVAVALFNDEACKEAFTADWLTVSLDSDKNITYTVVENTTYTDRKAYIQLTAPEANGTTEPAKVVIPVTQAGKDKVFASLAELVAADLTAGDEVTVTLNNDVIKSFYTITAGRAGVVFDVQKDGKDIKIFYNNQTTIVDWEVGGKLSGTLTNVKWSTYSNEWQLAPTANTWDWANLTYTAPATIASIAVTGTPTKTTYTDGEAFDPAGLVATATYTDATNEDVTNLVSWTFDPATLTKGTTSVNVTATLNSVSSAAYEVNGLTVNDIPTKTVAEFIAAGGVRCYLEGIVSNITNTEYGNFDLTDASGTIYVYGCLNAEGVAQKFAELGVKEGDRIKVVAEEYTYYQSTTHEVINAQYVSHISAATIEIADITMEVDETKTIAAIVTPEGAPVTYTIKAGSDDCITLNDAEITATEAGTATITATVAEGATYLGATKEFTVTVTTPDTRKKAVSPSPFTAVSGDMNPNDITFTSSKGGGTGGPNIKNDYIQLYQKASGQSYGGFITFNAVKGCKIDQVKIVTGNTTTTHIAYSVNDVMSATTENVQENAEYITEAGLNAESVNIYCMHTNSSNRLFIASAIVYYTGQPLADPELSWTSNAVELRVGETFTAPTLNNPYNVTGITYSSDNESLAKVNETTGAVTLVPDATGTATITATFDGNETYKAAHVSYTITVKSLPVSGVWELVTDVYSLAAGDKVVIVAKEYDYALSTTQNDNNRGQAAVTKNSDNTVAFGKDVQVLTLETGAVENTFALNTGKGYLYAASSSSNHLKTKSSKDDANASWKITIASGTASIVAQGTNTRNTMQYNQSSSLFACYASASQKALCLYMKKNVKVEGETDNSTIPNQSDVTVDNAELTVTTEAEYDNMYIGGNGTVKVVNEVTVNNLYISTTMGATTSGQISNATNTNLLINGDVFIDITLGKNGDPNQWHAFTVPFPVDAMNGVYDLNDNKLTNEVDYAIMDYHGDLRANGQYGWKKYRGILVPGTFYLMTVDGARSTYRFKKVEDAAIVAPATKAITAYTGTGDATKDKGWNGVGNPTLMHGKVGYKALILNPASYTYEAYEAEEVAFTVGTPFFIQAAADGTVDITAEGNSSLAPARRAAAAVENIKVMLGNSDYTDRLYVSASEDAINEYEIGKDLAKMAMTNTPRVVQISALAYDTRLCMIDAPMANNEALVALNLYAPANGEYTLSIEAQDNEKVYLLHDGTFVWDLSMSAYPITLNKGDNAGYSILVHRADAPTSVETIDGANNQTEKLIHNGNLYILHKGKVFDAVGTMLK